MGFFRSLLSRKGVSASTCHDPLLIVVSGKIYSWDGRRVELRGGSGVVHCLVQYRGAIFGGELGGIANYASGLDLNSPLTVRERDSTTALCVHDGNLFDASRKDNNHWEIRNTMTDELVGERSHPVLALASHAGTLYDGGGYGVHETKTSRKASDLVCDAMCSHNDRLYIASVTTIRDLNTGEPVGRAQGDEVTALCSFEGQLIHADLGLGIWETLSQRPIVSYDTIDKVRRRKSKTMAAACIVQAHGLT